MGRKKSASKSPATFVDEEVSLFVIEKSRIHGHEGCSEGLAGSDYY